MSPGRLVMAAALLLAACGPAEPPAPTIEAAWIRAMPPGRGMTAGYFTLRNPTSDEVRIVGARSDAFANIELHTTGYVDGVARMREESEVPVPPQGSVAFAPGGRHLMLFDPQRPIAAGETVELVIRLADGTELSAAAAVSRSAPDSGGH